MQCNRVSRCLLLGILPLTKGKGPLIVTGQVKGLRWKGEVNPLGLEALHNLNVHPIGVFKIIPILGRMIPVDDQNV